MDFPEQKIKNLLVELEKFFASNKGNSSLYEPYGGCLHEAMNLLTRSLILFDDYRRPGGPVHRVYEKRKVKRSPYYPYDGVFEDDIWP